MPVVTWSLLPARLAMLNRVMMDRVVSLLGVAARAKEFAKFAKEDLTSGPLDEDQGLRSQLSCAGSAGQRCL